MHDHLLSNTNRAKRNLTNNPHCAICEDQDESIIHILKDCKAAREVWRQVGGPANAVSFKSRTLQKWLIKNIKYQNRLDLAPETWHVFFAILVWWLWR